MNRFLVLHIGRLNKGEHLEEWERLLLHVRFQVGRIWVGWNA